MHGLRTVAVKHLGKRARKPAQAAVRAAHEFVLTRVDRRMRRSGFFRVAGRVSV
jgi:hypothetical protein